MQIHQFSPSCVNGDGVNNGMFLTRDLLRELGFISDIYCERIPEDLQHEVKHLSHLQLDHNDLLLVHHSLGYENCAWLNDIKSSKVMVYHNITSPQFSPENELSRLIILGREQLQGWAGDYLGAIGDSEINSDELRAANYPNIATIPLLFDVARMRGIPCEQGLTQKLHDACNILFVGRFCEHKHQLQLIEMLQELRHFSTQPVRLILVGDVTNYAYVRLAHQRIRDLHLEAQVIVTGQVSNTRLAALYRSADAYVSLSQHESFGMPLIEAMLYDVPVLARAGSGIRATMGEGAVLLDEDADPSQCAAQLHMLLTEPALRRHVIEAQRRNLQRFSRHRLRQQLVDYLSQLGLRIPCPPVVQDQTDTRPLWQIEGPFDSSYSLAIVNRELARALDRQSGKEHQIGLRSREGHGDFSASDGFLAANPDVAAMEAKAKGSDQMPDVVLRNCYPPTLDDMQGRVRVVHSYGWEETGFPTEYVNEFNRKLDLITVVSRFVGKVLRDNGIRIPIAVVGNGVDHILRTEPQHPSSDLLAGWRSFRFLHVSSCFPRKGIDALLAAYGRAFRNADDVTLVIKTFANPHNDVEQQLSAWQQKDVDYPHVHVIMDDYSQAQLRGLYQASHALVAPSRGEGFGLPVAEAMLLKLPVITTSWSGQMDFCDQSTSWLCDYQFVKSGSHFSATHSVWADPDVTHLATLLRQVYSSTEEQKLARTLPAYRRIAENFSWSDVAGRTSLAVEAVQQQPLLRKEPRIGWISTWNARCGIASYSAFLTREISDDRLAILTSYTSERTVKDAANVFRCWDAGIDETLDYAFETIIEQGISAVVIQYNFSFFTLAVLAQLIRRLKQASIAVHVFFHSTADLVRNDGIVSLRAIADTLVLADRLYAHGVEDLNRLKGFGLVSNVVLFPQGLMPTLAVTPQPDEQQLSGKTVIAAYGFLLPHKGIQPLIRAFASLSERDASMHLLLVNSLYPVHQSEHELHACQALINDFNLTERVTIYSEYLADEESQARLQRADLIVYPYQQTQESSSAAVRMGLAAGRPVAVTPLSIFDDVADAVHILPGTDPQSLAEGIAALLKDEQTLARKAEQAMKWTATRQWPDLSLRLLNVIDGIANALETDIGRI